MLNFLYKYIVVYCVKSFGKIQISHMIRHTYTIYDIKLV